MSQEILKKAITLAIKNGWRGTDDNAPTQWLSTLAKDQVAIDNAGGEDQLFFREDWFPVIFNHLFARALWGEDILIRPMEDFNNDTSRYYLPNWQYHLQQMVVAADPIVYLGKNIDTVND